MMKLVYVSIVTISILNLCSSLMLFRNTSQTTLKSNWCAILDGILSENDKSILKVLIVDSPPYSIFNERTELFEGIDVMTLETIAQALKMDIIFTHIDIIEFLSHPEMENFDILAGGLSSNRINSSNFIASTFYTQDELVFCVGRSKPIPQWLNLFYLHKDNETWIFGIILFSIVIVGVFLLTTFEPKPLDIWASAILSVQTVIGLPSTFHPTGILLQHIHVVFLFIALLVTSLYNAFTLHFLMYKIFRHQVSTVEEIIDGDFRLSGYEFALEYLKADPRFSEEKLRNFKICDEIDECLKKLSFDDRLAVATTRKQVLMSHFRDSIYCLDPTLRVRSYFVEFMIREDFRYILEFNDILNRIMMGGVITKWEPDFRYEEKRTGHEYRKASFDGILLLMGSILSFDIIVAILEWIVRWRSRKERAHRYWKLTDKLIDGKRYYLILENYNDNSNNHLSCG